MLGHGERDRNRVVAQPLDARHLQRVEARAGGRLGERHQISFTCSNGSRQTLQRRSAVQAVGPKRDSSSVAV